MESSNLNKMLNKLPLSKPWRNQKNSEKCFELVCEIRVEALSCRMKQAMEGKARKELLGFVLFLSNHCPWKMSFIQQ